jgi:outer membrane receptor protein involved in Fe transport
MTFSRSVITADVSARYYENNVPFAFNPLLAETGYSAGSPPFYTLSKHTNQTVGIRLTATPLDWWRSQLTFGVDRFGLRNVQTASRRTTESDTLLSIDDEHFRKLSVGYNTTLTGRVSPSLHGSLTLGIDHYVRDVSSLFTSQALNNTGTIRTSPPGSFNESLNTVENTGYFVQLQTSILDALFLTVGLRAEDNTTFGNDYGTAVLPRTGLSFVQPVGAVTLKLRGSYGKALRSPGAGQASGSATASAIQLENPTLRPEQQEGWDGGVDVILGSRGSLGVSVFDQTAKDLIAFLQVASVPVATYQYRNIGRVSNRGVEIEGTLRLSPWLQTRAQYGYVRSRIEAVGTAGGQVQVGDQPVNVPAHSAGLALTATPYRSTVFSAGVTYVGSRRQVDALALYRCLATLSDDVCPASFLSTFSTRAFNVTYPGFAKVNATVTHRFTPRLEAFVSVDNLTNNESYEFNNASPVMGRSTLVGLHLTY